MALEQEVRLRLSAVLPANSVSANVQYERENNYPIDWVVTDGLKRDCIANGAKQ